MPVLCWGNLAKSATDSQRIEEAMDQYILRHNEDPMAHIGEDYSLGVHRLQAVLDHADYSVINAKIEKFSRAFRYIVGSGDGDDFEDIQDAIDAANAEGGGRIFIKNGIYHQTADLVLYDNIELIGEDDDFVKIDFDDGNYRVKAIGTAETHKKNIVLRDIQIRESSSSQSALYLEYADDVNITGVYFYDNGSYDVEIKNCERIRVDFNRLTNSGNGIKVDSSSYITITKNTFESTTNPYKCVYLKDNASVTIAFNYAKSITGWFVYGEFQNDDVQIMSNYGDGLRMHGIYLENPPRAIVAFNALKAKSQHTYNNPYDGINVYQDLQQYAGMRVSIIGNSVEHFQRDGIRIHLKNSLVNNNVIFWIGGKSIRVWGDFNAYNAIIGNNFKFYPYQIAGTGNLARGNLE